MAIESSCDDTSAAVIQGRTILSNIIASQKIHQDYGGVVPELASREHQKNIIPVVEAALKKADINKKDLDAIAVTQGPGLLGSLLVGVSFAKSLALSLGIPLIGVNHMRAHILAQFIENIQHESELDFPLLCLTVSGGHTQIVKVESSDSFEIMGETIDDAAGEAFDKVAKILGLPYPGGPEIDKLSKSGNPLAYDFTEPRVGELDFSFSGLKTNILYFLQSEMKKNSNFIEENIHDLCASIQSRIVSILIGKMAKAAQKFQINNLCLAGGVSANSLLRSEFKELGKRLSCQTFIPDFQYCTDNAGMIAITAHFQYENSDFETSAMTPKARWSVSTRKD